MRYFNQLSGLNSKLTISFIQRWYFISEYWSAMVTQLVVTDD
jgi:hypothetical protein